MAVRTRRLLRSALLLAILGGVGVLVGITVVSRPGEPKVEASEGWTVRGFRQTRYDGGTPVLSVTAEEARLERPRFGPFRIGVARQLIVHEAKVDLLAGAATADRAGAFAGGDPWKAACAGPAWSRSSSMPTGARGASSRAGSSCAAEACE